MRPRLTGAPGRVGQIGRESDHRRGPGIQGARHAKHSVRRSRDGRRQHGRRRRHCRHPTLGHGRAHAALLARNLNHPASRFNEFRPHGKRHLRRPSRRRLGPASCWCERPRPRPTPTLVRVLHQRFTNGGSSARGNCGARPTTDPFSCSGGAGFRSACSRLQRRRAIAFEPDRFFHVLTIISPKTRKTVQACRRTNRVRTLSVAATCHRGSFESALTSGHCV